MKKSFAILLLFISAVAGTAEPQPVLSISANHGAVVELPKGWPLIVTGTLFHSDRLNKSVAAGPLIIDPPNGGSWVNAIELRVTAADGSEKVWNFRPTGVAEQRVLTMGQRQFVPFGWVLSPAETAAIPTGEYRLAARIALQGALGWSGEVTSASVSLTVIEEPAALDEEKASEKATLRARYEVGAGNLAMAGSVIDQFLAAYPTNSRALVMRSRILETQGQTAQAWFAAKEALTAEYRRSWAPQEPPFSLVAREQELWRRLTVPRLSAAWTGGALQLKLAVDQGSSYSIETSDSLINWTAVLSVAPTNQNGVIVFPAPVTDNERHRFYRALASP